MAQIKRAARDKCNIASQNSKCKRNWQRTRQRMIPPSCGQGHGKGYQCDNGSGQHNINGVDVCDPIAASVHKNGTIIRAL